jgi:hypothetical protein
MLMINMHVSMLDRGAIGFKLRGLQILNRGEP